MSDVRVREAERQAAAGDPEAETRLLSRRLRSGELDLQQVQLAAYLGSLSARRVIGAEEWPAPIDSPLAWLRGLAAWGPKALHQGVVSWLGETEDDRKRCEGLDPHAKDYLEQVEKLRGELDADEPIPSGIAPPLSIWALESAKGLLTPPADMPQAPNLGAQALLHGALLGPIDGEQLSELLSALRGQDRWLKIDALGSLAYVAKEHAVLAPFLLGRVADCLQDSDADVREAAATAIRRVDSCGPSVVAALERCFAADPNPDVRFQAAASLTHLVPTQAPDALHALRCALRTGEDTARTALLDVCPEEVEVHDAMAALSPRRALGFVTLASLLAIGLHDQADGWSALPLVTLLAVACVAKFAIALRARREAIDSVLADGILFLGFGWLSVVLALASGAWFVIPLGLAGLLASLSRFSNYFSLRRHVPTQTHSPTLAGETP